MDLPLDQTTGSFTKLGAGTLELAAANTFTGNVTASNGVLRISQASALGGATKDVFCTSGIARIELDGSSGDITLPATTRFQTSGAQTNGALRNVAGNNTIAGQLLLTTGAGNTQILSEGGTLNLTGAITTSPSAGARTLFLGGSANGITSGGIADNGTNVVSVTKNGGGTWEIRGTNTHSGLTTASAGTLALAGSLAGPLTATGGTLAPLGSPSVGGNLAINSGAKIPHPHQRRHPRHTIRPAQRRRQRHPRRHARTHFRPRPHPGHHLHPDPESQPRSDFRHLQRTPAKRDLPHRPELHLADQLHRRRWQ